MGILSSKKKRLFISLLFSYSLLLTIPIIVYMGVFIKATYEIQEGINEEYWKSLVQLKTSVDRKLVDIEKLSYMIGWNQRVGKIYSMTGRIEPIHIYTIREIMDELQLIKSSNNYIREFFVYFRNNDFVLNNSGKFGSSEFFDLYCANDLFSYEKWLEYISRSCNNSFSSARLMNINSKGVTTYYMQSFPVGMQKVRPSANLVVALNTDEIAAALRSMQWIKESTVLVINSNNQLVAATQEMALPEFLQYQNLQNEKSVFYRNVKGENNIVFSIDSEVCDWKYVVLLPTGVFLKNIISLNRAVLFGVLVCIALGGYAAYYFARRNSTPVSKMIEYISEKLGIKNELRTNEYAFIENALMQVIDEKEKISSRMNEHTDILRTDFLTRLIRGRLDDDQNVEEAFERYDIRFPHPNYMLLLFAAEKGEAGILNIGDEKDRMLAYFVVRNVIEELLGADHALCFFDVGDVFCCILNTGCREAGGVMESVDAAMATGMPLLAEKFGLHVSVAVSDLHHGKEGIPDAYMEAADALDYKILLGDGRPLFYTELKNSPATGQKTLYSLGDQQRFLNSIKTGDYESARNLMNNIFEELFRMGNLSTDMTKCLMFSIINTLMNAIDAVSSAKDSFWSELNAFARLVKCGTVQEMKKEMNVILASVREYAESRRQQPEGNKSDRFARIKRYIDSNFREENLNVAMISGHFGMNQSYLSRCFKEQFGEGVLDYICRVRLETAQKLLLTTNLSIKEAGGRVGFYNSNAFIRSFKRHFGITPGQYRELYTGEKNFADGNKMNMPIN